MLDVTALEPTSVGVAMQSESDTYTERSEAAEMRVTQNGSVLHLYVHVLLGQGVCLCA